MNNLLRALLLAWFCCNFAVKLAFATVDDDYAKAYGINNLHLYDQAQLAQLLPKLKRMGFNTITTTIIWRVVELQPGPFDFTRYQIALDYLQQSGFKFILILDSSGRPLLDLEGQVTNTYAIPDWLWQQHPQALSVDFNDLRQYNLDFHDWQHLPFLERFYRTTISYLKKRYVASIRAFVPGIMHELEVKYPQYGYRWQSYSAAAKQEFAAWLAQQGKPASDLPNMAYANNIAYHTAVQQPLFADFMRFREQSLKRYVCSLTDLIRQYELPAAGYFGQSFTSHDAIYALGVIEEVVECFDHITVDYNYYDGWQVKLNPYILPVLINYAYNLGYQHVIAGLYLERFYTPENNFLTTNLIAPQKTLALLAQDPPDGLEIANIKPNHLAPITPIRTPELNLDAKKSEETIKVGIVTSKWTYYLWIGEHSNERNIIEDALLESYRLLSREEGFSVEILGERALLKQDLSRYDVLYMPHQTTLSDEALLVIREYYANGGRLAQDVQFDSYSLDGSKKSGWQNDVFGIAKIRWRQRDEKFVYQGQRVILPDQTRNYFSSALLQAKLGFRVTMPKFSRLDRGLILRGPRTLAFGFLPQLIEDKDKPEFWQQLFIDSIRKLVKK